MKRSGIVLSTIAVLAMVAACGGSEGKAKEPEAPAAAAEPAKPAEPVVLTQEQKIEAFKACFGHFAAKDAKGAKDCYAAEAVHEFIDGGDGAETGPDAIIEGVTPYWQAFPDLGADMRLVLVNGNNIADVYGVWGTMSGELQGMPATNKPMGLVNLETIEVNDQGKFVKHIEFINVATFMAQLTGAKGPHREPIAASGAEPVVVVATDSDAEKANVEAFGKAVEMWNARDWKGFQATLAKDIVWADQLAPADIKGASKVMAFHKELAGAFKDSKLEATNTWAAGDYVYSELTFTGTNNGAFKTMGLKKKTGKPVTMHVAFISKMTEGKVSEFWVFGNGMAFALQLGLIQPPAPKAEGDAPADG